MKRTARTRVAVTLCASTLALAALTVPNSTTAAAALNSGKMAKLGLFGTVENRLPKEYTVMVASFESNGPTKCNIWNPSGGNDGNAKVVRATWNCRVRWLPSGKTTDSEFGWFYDADAFMVASDYIYSDISWGQTPPAYMWTRFHDYKRVICQLDRYNRVLCYTEIL